MIRTLSLVSLALLTGCAAAKLQIIEESMIDIWEHGNLARIDAAYEPELGHELKRFVTENRELYPDIRVSIVDSVIKGNRYVTVWTVTGTHKDLGRKVVLEGVSVRTREDGKIVEEHMFYDAKSIYDQLGFTVTPPAGLSPFSALATREEPSAPPPLDKPTTPETPPAETPPAEPQPTEPPALDKPVAPTP